MIEDLFPPPLTPVTNRPFPAQAKCYLVACIALLLTEGQCNSGVQAVNA